jgi:hypothetical protein
LVYCVDYKTFLSAMAQQRNPQSAFKLTIRVPPTTQTPIINDSSNKTTGTTGSVLVPAPVPCVLPAAPKTVVKAPLMPFKFPDTTINPNQAPPSTKKAYWTHADEKDLVRVLLDHKSESGNGSNFKATMFQVAVIMLEKTHTRGGPKDVKSCKNKWQQVHVSPYISTNLTH